MATRSLIQISFSVIDKITLKPDKAIMLPTF